MSITAIYGLLDEDNIDQLEDLVSAGVSGFKCFMGNTFGDLPAPSDGAMLEGFEILARLGYRCTVHAENPSIMARREAQLKAAGRNDARAHLRSTARDLRHRSGRSRHRLRRMDRRPAPYRSQEFG